MSHLYIIRGLPGSGKSTLGEKLCPGTSYAADDFHPSGPFNPANLPAAHAQCLAVVTDILQHRDVAVCNTFTRLSEMAPYTRFCSANGHTFSVIHCETGPWKSIHNVPASTISAMRKRWEPI